MTMKKIFYILLFLFSFNASLLRAATYYFSSSTGSDSYTTVQAQDQATPWQTISKLNEIMGTLLPGDKVLFLRGDSFPGTITIGASGSASNPITFGAYGSGTSKPILDNRLVLTGWTDLGGNIWEYGATSSEPTAPPSANLENQQFSGSSLTSMPTALMINDVLQPLGRYPNIDATNRGYLKVSSHPAGSKAVFTDATLAGVPDWTGAEAVLRTTRWTLERRIVASHSSQTITLNSNTSYEIPNNYGYFFQNHPSALDKDGEWCYIATGNKIRLYSTTDPNTMVIKVANTDKYFDINSKSNLVINGFVMLGAKKVAIDLSNTSYCTIKNCEFVASGINALIIGSYGATNNDSISIINNIFTETQSSCINANGNRLAFIGNTITNTGFVPGMAESGSSWGIQSIGNGITLERNVIENTGYVPIIFHGNDVLVKENSVNYFCSAIDDGGGIYTQSGTGAAVETNRKIINNIVLNGVGAPDGTNSTSSSAEGIYIDDRSFNVEISGNTIAYCTNTGIFLHNAATINVKNNTIFSCNTALSIKHDNIAPTYPVVNSDIQNNLLVSNSIDPTKSLFSYRCIAFSELASLGTLDNNIYCQPFLNADYIKYQATSPSDIRSLNLADWQTLSGRDLQSLLSPISYTPYEPISTSNLIANGTFDIDFGGWGRINGTNATLTRLWDNTNQLDGGSLSVNVTGGSFNSSTITKQLSSTIIAGKTYLLRLSTKSTTSGSVECYLYQNAAPYKSGSFNFTLNVGPTRQNQEILFTAIATLDINSSLLIKLGAEDGTVYFDNVELYEVTPINPNSFIRFEYNTLASARTITADKNYITPESVKYAIGSSVSIPSFGSVVLLENIPASWTGSTSTDWNTASNWSGLLIPTASTDVIIPSGTTFSPVVNLPSASSAVCSNLTIQSGATLTIAPAGALTVNGLLTNNATSAGLVIQSDASGTGSLIAGTVSGSATAQRWMTAGAWHMVSSPLSGQTVASFLTSNGNIATNGANRGMMDYNPVENVWNDFFTNATGGNLGTGNGFSMRVEGLLPENDAAVTFAGSLQAGTQSATGLSASAWNCIGNPYTSAIGISNGSASQKNLLTANSIDALNFDINYGIYIWDKTDESNGISGNYTAVSNVPGLYNNVQQGQAFFVKMNAGKTAVSFTPSMQIHNTPLALKSAKGLWPTIKLETSAGNQKSYTIIAFSSGMTTGLDPTYDAGLLKGASDLIVYTRLVKDNGIPFAIQALPDSSYSSMLIPVGIDFKTGGAVVFSSTLMNLPADCNVVLEDKLLKKFTDLSKGNYTVTIAANSSISDRFQIHTSYLTTGLNVTENFAGQLSAYAVRNTEIHVEGEVSKQAVATLYDIQGRVVLVKNMEEGSLNVIPTPNLKTGIYLLFVKDNKRAQGFKVPVKE